MNKYHASKFNNSKKWTNVLKDKLQRCEQFYANLKNLIYNLKSSQNITKGPGGITAEFY